MPMLYFCISCSILTVADCSFSFAVEKLYISGFVVDASFFFHILRFDPIDGEYRTIM